MSRSPTQRLAKSVLSDDYSEAENQLFQLVKAGYSFSGHEKNCAYLGLGKGRFANVSAVAGFDYLDDGRSMALSDWDQDGDLDVWLLNRTAPRARFLNNVGESENHYLSVRLQGRSCNRDAIGARVVADLGNTSQKKLMRTLRAGEGYLGQSSKWLHFGLGNAQRVERLVVHWPGGPVEEFRDLQVDRHYRIAQGDGTVLPWEKPVRKLAIASSRTKVPQTGRQSRSFLTARVPLPAFEFHTEDGDETNLSQYQGAPVLVNLWASWCQPCVLELQEMARNEQSLRECGLQVLTLSVEALQPDNVEKASNTILNDRLLEESRFPFATGRATASLVGQMQAAHNYLFKPHRPLPLPTSFLIDSSGQLAAIYKGRVDIEQLVDDVKKLELHGASLVRAALPFEGRWYAPPAKPSLLPFVAELIEQRAWDAAIAFTGEHMDELRQDPGYPELLHRIGRQMLDRNDPEAAADYFRQAVAIKPDHADGYFNLGIALAEMKQLDDAVANYRLAIQLDDAHVKAHNNLANLLRETGNLREAGDHYRQVLKLNPDLIEARQNLGNLLIALGRLDEARPHLQTVVGVQPKNAQAHNNLGFLLASSRQLDQGIAHYRRALQLDESYAQAHNNLASALALQRKLPQAIEHLRKAVSLDAKFVDAHKNLGRMLLAQKNVDAAIEALHTAAELRPDDPETQRFLSLALLAQGDLASSIRHARRAVRLDPIDARSCLRLGELLSNQGMRDEAIDWFRQALELSPENALAHNRLGLSLASAGSTEEAVQHLRRSLRLERNAPQVLLALAHLLTASEAVDASRSEEAIELAEQAAQLTQHQSPQALVTLALTYATAGRWAEAIRAQERAIELAQAAGATPSRLSNMHNRLGSYRQAYEKANRESDVNGTRHE